MPMGVTDASRDVAGHSPVALATAPVHASDANEAIHEAQRCIVEAFDLDGSTLFERSEDGDLLGTHGWWRPDVPAPPAHLSARESFPYAPATE